jgi:hypothetical protein
MFRILWSVNYYDGPLSGICIFDNKLAWFTVFNVGGYVCIEQAQTNSLRQIGSDKTNSACLDLVCWIPRIWQIKKLSLKQKIYEIFKHNLWLFLVKINCTQFYFENRSKKYKVNKIVGIISSSEIGSVNKTGSDYYGY